MDERHLNRVRFRAWRRGFREADLILGPFADSRAPEMSAERLERFERLLEQADHDIYAWVVGAEAPPPEFDDDLLAELRAFRPAEGGTAIGG
jgi:antitoxin CptB